MATKLNREQMRAAKTPAIGKPAAAPRRREAGGPGREASRSACACGGRCVCGEDGKSTICRFELADIRSIAIERHSPLCLIIVVNPPKPG
ncbi:MAG TPA: hypothetical protein VJ527_02710 [Rhodanobacter sp.]|nr:hypothetical protein [Rhodanobacter sp.]